MPSNIETVVRGLLNKTVEKGCTREEAFAAAEKATELITKYNIDIDVLNASAESAEAKIVQVDQVFTDNVNAKDLFEFRSSLAHAIAKHMYCSVIQSAWSRTIHYIGRPMDIEMCKALASSMEDAIREFRRSAEKGHRGKDLTTFRVAFYQAAVREIWDRLAAKKVQMQQADTNVRALVVYTDSAIKDFVHENFGRTRTVRRRRVQNYAGTLAGRKAGQAVDIHGDRTVGAGALRLRDGRQN